MSVGTVTRQVVDPHGIRAPIAIGDLKMTVTTVVGSASYTTGGDALTAAQLGLGTVMFGLVDLVASSGSANAAIKGYYDAANSKLQVFSATDGAGVPVAETASTTDVSGLTFRVVAFGY